jgi:hypothetical protein
MPIAFWKCRAARAVPAVDWRAYTDDLSLCLYGECARLRCPVTVASSKNCLWLDRAGDLAPANRRRKPQIVMQKAESVWITGSLSRKQPFIDARVCEAGVEAGRG